MTVLLSYDSTLSRVQIQATGLTGAISAVVERSTDGIQWTTVRGAADLAVIGDTLGVPVDDFEFPAGVAVTYRVRAIGSASPISYVAVGTGSTGADGPQTPGLPAGIVSGDLLLLLASVRNTTGAAPDTPAGWTHLVGAGNLRLYGRIWDGVFAAPTVTYTGGASNEDTLAQIAGFRNAKLSPVIAAMQNNGTATHDIAFPGQGTLPETGMLILYVGWKPDVWTSVDNLVPGFTHEISELTSSAGLGAGQVWDYYLPATTAPIFSGSFNVIGGVTAVSRGGTVGLTQGVTNVSDTAVITPTLGAVFLKSISRPFLNLPVNVRLASTVQVGHQSRGAVFQIVGRSKPIAVGAARGARQWTMLVRTETAAERDHLDLLLASGDTLLVQSPPDTAVESGYVSVGDVTRDAHPLRPLSWLFTLPMTEVNAPGPQVVGATVTWQTVLDTYATWADLLAANATWADLLTLVGDPSEVIVP